VRGAKDGRETAELVRGTVSVSDDAGPYSIAELPRFDERRFEIGAERARGGVGMVMEARDRLLRRQVAVKQPQHSDQGGARFVREALITAQLQHPAIVPIYDFGVRDSGDPCYAMRLVPGATLRDAIMAARGLDERLALLPHVQAVADAVAYAHSQGVIHRDLKPGNVLVGPFGETVVIDWGLAKYQSEADTEPPFADLPMAALGGNGTLTEAGMVLGTPGYMSPEQARGEDVDERADVYAIGAILYYLLAGQSPFLEKSATEVLRPAATSSSPTCHRPSPAVQSHEPGAPRDLVAIVNKAMARDPADRYPTATALAHDLKRFATGQLVGARQYSTWALVRRLIDRHRATAVVAAALVVALVVGVVAVMFERGRTAVERDHATAENNRLRLMQAQAVLERDPTAALAWLKTYRADRAGARQAVEVAARAEAAGAARHVLTLPGDTPLQVCLAASGQLAGVLGRDGGIWLFDLARGTRRHLGKLPEAPLRCLFADGDRQLVAAAGRRNGLMSAQLPDGLARPMTAPGGTVAALQALGDRALLITGRDGRAHVVSLQGGETRTLDLPAGVEELIPTADGRIGYGLDGDGALWQIQFAGGPATRLQAAGRVKGFDVAPDGRQLALGRETDLGVQDVASGQIRWRQSVRTPRTSFIRFAGGGVIVMASMTDDVRWWDGRGGDLVILGKQPGTKSLEVSRDGGRAAWLDMQGTVYVADLPGAVVRTWVGHHTATRSMAMTPEGHWLAVTHGAAVRIFFVPPAAESRRIPLGMRPRVQFHVRPLAARGEVLAVVREREIVAFDGRSGAARPLLTVPAGVRRLAVSHGGKWAAIHPFEGPPLLLDLASGRNRVIGRPMSRYSLRFAGEDQLVGLDGDGTVHWWDLARDSHRVLLHLSSGFGAMGGLIPARDGSRVLADAITEGVLIDLGTGRTMPLDYGGGTFMGAAISWDGSKLAISFGDGRVRLWERNGEGMRPRTLTRREGYAIDMHFTRDQQALFIADETGAVCRVELPAGTVTEIGRHSARIASASLSPSERWLVSSDERGEVRIWEPSTGTLGVLAAQGRREVLFLGDDRLVSVASEGWLDILPFDPTRLAPPQPAALSRWLDNLTTAQITPTGEPASRL
jgi:eukaryotic-like serine/threonine-protein kinase